MKKCGVCGGRMKTARRDVERVIDGHRVRVLDLTVNVCSECDHITTKWWTSFDEIDCMLKARLEREQFEAITWDNLISSQVFPVLPIF
ncbi:MAG: hypothetical protein GX573_26230 [Chloroflexi bacterium]|nr:hypothetical protein [Chloroflexota bacterium]